MSLFDSAFGIHALAMEVRSKRAEVLAANIANADTPNYQARDFDFKAVLNGMQSGTTLARSDERHLSNGNDMYFGTDLQYRMPAQGALDQNTVDVQAERAQFLDNALRYQASVRFMDSRLTSLVRAFRGE
ncbi:MAG: flagellar basal body rod protein FlgB [Gammaproteobacteria bacterium]|nr:flagellar basal body rod protein FlgB [Gammaproteobacteria bacterium]